MKAALAVFATLSLLAGPAFAEGDILKASLADATRQEMAVAPWVGISVKEVVRGDTLVWVADTGGGQRYACATAASADAVLSRDIACMRLGAVPMPLKVREAAYVTSQRARLPYPGQYSEYGFPAHVTDYGR